MRSTYLSYVRGNNGNFCHRIEYIVEPSGKKCTASLCKVEARDSAELDAETLQEDGEEITQ